MAYPAGAAVYRPSSIVYRRLPADGREIDGLLDEEPDPQERESELPELRGATFWDGLVFDSELPHDRESEYPDPAPVLGFEPDELPHERESDGLALLGRLLVDGLEPLDGGGALLGPQLGPPPGSTITGPPQPKPKGR